MSRWKKYLTTEIGIEFKACLYFYCILFFYCIYQLIGRTFTADILIMAEMVLAAYLMGYVQVYLFNNFDESEKYGLKEGISSVICSLIYVLVSYLGGWFHRNLLLVLWFFLYMMFCYVIIFGVYKIKRDIDTKQLNKDLDSFKEHLNKGGIKNE